MQEGNFLPMRQNLSYLAVLENCVSPMGWDSSHAKLKVSSELLISEVMSVSFPPPRKTPNDVRNRSLCDVKCQKIKEATNDKIINFNVIDKRNNQHWSQLQIEKSQPSGTDNAGNTVNLVSGIIRLPSSWDFSVCIRDR